jgi:DNA-binding beta-propeller fold protein YncE
MKWNNAGRSLKVLNILGVSLAVGLGMTACSRDYTVAYLYVTSATKTTAGAINAYAVDYQTGAIEQLTDSPIPSGGDDPVTIVAAPSGKYVYVLNNISSTVVQFAVGTDGKLYGQKTTNVVQNTAQTIIGTLPTAASIDPSGNFLFITFTYQNGYTAARPGPGGFAVYPISATDGSLGAPLVNTTLGGATTANPLPYFPVGNNPAGIFVAKNNLIYVIDDEVPTTGSPYGVLLVYSASTLTSGSTPVITQIAGTYHGGFAAGTSPAGVAVDPTGAYIYVTDSATNQLYGYAQINNVPTPLRSSPFNTGNDPLGITVDPRGEYVYVANFGSSTISSYAIAASNGNLSGTASGAVSVDTGPTCVAIEPALGIYLYSSNKVDNSVSAEQLKPETGALTPVQGTPFTAQALPTCAVAVANGAHATQVIQ